MKLDERAFAKELAHAAIHEHGAVQTESELASLIYILRTRARNVRTVLEIGVYLGGTFWLWTQLWPKANVVGIDDMSAEYFKCAACDEHRAHNGCPFKMHERNTAKGHMLYRKSEQLAPHFKPETIDILHIDGDHSARGIRKDWNNYSRTVKKGSGLIILHDVVTPEWDVAEFWAEFGSWRPGAFKIHDENGYGIGIVPC